MKGVVSFYGKPNCTGNKKQKQMLRDAGYLLEERDILSTNWEPEMLGNFFTGVGIRACLNDRAPKIKSGEFQSDSLSDEQIMDEMIKDPILIKRPLIFFRGEFCCGFDTPLVAKLLGQEAGEVGCGCETD